MSVNGAKVLILEDDKGILDEVVHYLKDKGYIIFRSRDDLIVLEIIKRVKPDIILIDMVDPGQAEYEVCSELRKRTYSPILLLSNQDNTADKIRGFEAGGDDYITKPVDLAELEVRMRASLRWKSVKIERVRKNKRNIQYENLRIDLSNYQVFLDEQPISLYTKELKLLLLLIKNENQIFSAEQLYNQIWGESSVGNLKTVMVHISNLRRKIEKDPAHPRFIKTIRGFGYKFSS